MDAHKNQLRAKCVENTATRVSGNTFPLPTSISATTQRCAHQLQQRNCFEEPPNIRLLALISAWLIKAVSK
eukprot:m.1268414 g.1268414  ORF g.1268414 m.1268414 type:complete len:71 (+) comp24745_c0_seq7:4961-5173(+)